MINQYIIAGLSTIIVAESIVFWLKYKRLKEYNKVMAELVASANKYTQDNLDQSKEDFVKFLSESRDWAFDYIEQVQTGLKQFVDKVDKDIEYFDQYGDVMSMRYNYESLKVISEAYKEIKNLLPEDSEK